MARDGTSRVLADRIDGEPIGKVNFVLRDSKDRIWITVSTRMKNWMHALRTDLADGYLARYENGRVQHRGRRLPLHQRDPLRRQRRVPVCRRDDRRVHHAAPHRRRGQRRSGARSSDRRRSAGAPGPTALPSTPTGNLWGTLVYSDKLFVLTPEGDMRVLLDEGDPPEGATRSKRRSSSNTVTEDVLFATGRGLAPWMASVTFGGPDLQTVYIGSLKGTRIPSFRAPVPGLPMVHWNEKPSGRAS